MSDAEIAIRKSIQIGMGELNAKGVIKTEDDAVSGVMACVFAIAIRWAVVAYLEELEG